jgi:hypothetical protein
MPYDSILSLIHVEAQNKFFATRDDFAYFTSIPFRIDSHTAGTLLSAEELGGLRRQDMRPEFS